MNRTLAAWIAAGACALASLGAAAQTAQGAAWTEAQIRGSRTVAEADAGERPAVDGNGATALFVVVDRDGQRLTLVDGARQKLIGQLDTVRPVQGAPVVSPDGRHAFVGSADGWVTKFDLRRKRLVAQIRTGLTQRQIAISSDGQWVMVANALPMTAVLLNSDLELHQVYAGATLDGKSSSPVAAVVDASVRSSFVLALETVPEVWEISYDPHAEDIFDGIVHDYRMGEGIPRRGFLGIRRSRLPAPMTDLWLDPQQAQVLGRVRAVQGSAVQAQVVNLDVRRRVAELPVRIWPTVPAMAAWPWQGGTLVALPDAMDSGLSLLDRRNWALVKTIATEGPAAQVAAHPSASAVWVGSAGGGIVQVGKASLEVVGTLLTDGPVKRIRFSEAGDAVAVLFERELVFYDAGSGQVQKRLAVEQPTDLIQVDNTPALQQRRRR